MEGEGRVKTYYSIGLSKYTIGFLTGMLCGTFLGNFIFVKISYLFFILIILPFLFFILRKRAIAVLVIVGLFGFSLALIRFQFARSNNINHSLVYDSAQQIEVIVLKSTLKNTYQEIEAKSGEDKILIQTELFPKYQYGDKLSVYGKIDDPKTLKSKDFDYGSYLMKKGVFGLVKFPKIQKTGWQGNRFLKNILDVGNKLSQKLNQIYPEPNGTLATGLILGQKNKFSTNIESDFSRAGLTHLTAVSGYNVTLVILLIASFLSLISRKISFYGAVGSTILFVIITGGNASVLRAGLLAVLALIGKYFGRRINYLILLLLTANLMLLINPYDLMNNLSFQLSFMAFTGLMYLAEPIKRLIIFLPEKPSNIISETISAQIMVLPILIYNFGLVSISAPIANLLILPLIPIAMFLVISTGLVGFVALKLAIWLSFLSNLIFKYIFWVSHFFGSGKWSAVSLKIDEWWWIPVYYLLIFIWISYTKEKGKLNAKTKA